jgi:hypothetical protein
MNTGREFPDDNELPCVVTPEAIRQFRESEEALLRNPPTHAGIFVGFISSIY